MGKSSLMVRTAIELERDGISVVVLDLTAIGHNVTPEQWYNGLLSQLARPLQVEDELEELWWDHGALGPLQRWHLALYQVILPRVSRLVIFIDEIDAVSSLPFRIDEFFAHIRGCYNNRSLDPLYQRVTFCLMGVATPSDLISDNRISPFNIGRRIDLSDFTAREAATLAVGLNAGGIGTEEERLAVIERILYWTGGHPYLTQCLCVAVGEQKPGLTANSASASSRVHTSASRPRPGGESARSG